MKASELRELGPAELEARERELTEELFHLRLKRVTAQPANPMKVRTTRRDLARLKTLMRQRARGGGAA